MIKYCVKKWDSNKEILRKALAATELTELTYFDLVKIVVRCVLNANEDDDYEQFDEDNITEIDNGDYQGTLIYMIPRRRYQPHEYDYLMTYVGYGSCCVCDTLKHLQCLIYPSQTDEDVNEFLKLCKDILTNMIKPYNGGWRNEEEFEECDAE